jgi:hypothetical protein
MQVPAKVTATLSSRYAGSLAWRAPRLGPRVPRILLLRGKAGHAASGRRRYY